MYYDFFGFREPPFSIAPDPRYLYLSDRHKEALAHLMYGVQGQGGFIVITGEVAAKRSIKQLFVWFTRRIAPDRCKKGAANLAAP
ncbi:MAG: hypothetical protein R6T87_03425 [Marinobacter sp.]